MTRGCWQRGIVAVVAFVQVLGGGEELLDSAKATGNIDAVVVKASGGGARRIDSR